MTVADKPHGRSRYNAGCRCGECRAANREHSRRRRSKRLTAVPPAEGSQPPEFADGAVTEAVRAQLAETAVALERPGLVAIAIRLAQLLDNQAAIPQHAAAAHRLTETLTTLSKTSTRRGRGSASASGARPAGAWSWSRGASLSPATCGSSAPTT